MVKIQMRDYMESDLAQYLGHGRYGSIDFDDYTLRKVLLNGEASLHPFYRRGKLRPRPEK